MKNPELLKKGYSALEFYEHLFPEVIGKVYALPEEITKSQKMREYLLKKFGTSAIETIEIQDLRAALEEEKLVMDR